MTLIARNIIDHLSGVVAGSPVDIALSARPDVRRVAQDAYSQLFGSSDEAASLFERRALGAFAAALENEPESVAHFHALMQESDPSNGHLSRIVSWEALLAAAPGPYGRFPPGPLSADDLDGPVYRASRAACEELGLRLATALEHIHLLILHPRDANQDSENRLLDSGWTPAGVALVVQIAGFIGFQSRIVAGLRAVAASRRPSVQRLSA